MRMDGKGCRRRSRRRHNSIENYLANGRVEYSKTCKVQRVKTILRDSIGKLLDEI